jgi:rhodanese-related sulfurtransferase
MCSRSAARVMLRSSATATKYLTNRSSGCIGAAYGTPTSRSWTRRAARGTLGRMTNTISRAELRDAIESGTVTVVEALPAPYYEDAHLPGAINIPHTEVQQLAPELLPDKDAAIVTYCSNTACPNSGIAAAQLTKLGYTNVRKYAEGKQDWTEAGLPLEHGAPVAG